MALPPISSVGAGAGAEGVSKIKPVGDPNPLEGVDFGSALDAVANAEREAGDLATRAATGHLQDVHEFTAAAAKASLAVELTVAVRDRAVEAYQEIMRMQI